MPMYLSQSFFMSFRLNSVVKMSVMIFQGKHCTNKYTHRIKTEMEKINTENVKTQQHKSMIVFPEICDSKTQDST